MHLAVVREARSKAVITNTVDIDRTSSYGSDRNGGNGATGYGKG